MLSPSGPLRCKQPPSVFCGDLRMWTNTLSRRPSRLCPRLRLQCWSSHRRREWTHWKNKYKEKWIDITNGQSWLQLMQLIDSILLFFSTFYETNSLNDLDIVCDPPSKWYLLSRVNPPSLSFLHVNTRKERSRDAVTTRKLSCTSKEEEKSVLVTEHGFAHRWNRAKLTTHMEEMGKAWSLKVASKAPFREQTCSSWPAANTKQLLSFASRRISWDLVLRDKAKDSTCCTAEWADGKKITRGTGQRKKIKPLISILCRAGKILYWLFFHFVANNDT